MEIKTDSARFAFFACAKQVSADQKLSPMTGSAGQAGSIQNYFGNSCKIPAAQGTNIQELPNGGDAMKALRKYIRHAYGESRTQEINENGLAVFSDPRSGESPAGILSGNAFR